MKSGEVNAIKEDWNLLSCSGKWIGTGYLQETTSRGVAQLSYQHAVESPKGGNKSISF